MPGWNRRCLAIKGTCALALGLFAATSLHAANIGVSPTLIELAVDESVSGLRVTNGDATAAVNVQARLLRWQQVAGEDVYTPAEGVVASPPLARVQPGAENLIRIVRTDKTPITGEESYRLLIDQLPDPGTHAANTIAILIRHSVPVFFAGTARAPAQPQWRIERAVQTLSQENPPPPQPGWRVTVTNAGATRIRLADMDLLDEAGRVVGQNPGLVGYVLGGAHRQFFVPQNGTASAPPARLRIAVRDESQTIETTLLPVAP